MWGGVFGVRGIMWLKDGVVRGVESHKPKCSCCTHPTSTPTAIIIVIIIIIKIIVIKIIIIIIIINNNHHHHN